MITTQKFFPGDTVEIIRHQTAEHDSHWIGLTGTVLPVSQDVSTECWQTRIAPLSARPDGRGRIPFNWTTNNLRLVAAQH